MDKYIRLNHDLLVYGKVLHDDEYTTYPNDSVVRNIRSRVINLDGRIYFHKMVNGEIEEIILVGRAL